jgi:hypothetical protein
MFYSYKQCPIQINGRTVFATEASINCENSLATTYLSDKRHSFGYVPGGPLEGSFKFSHYLTGNDFIKDLILEEDTPSSGNFGGITFTGGYLKSYSLNASAFGPALINSEILFFDQPNGSFSPTSSTNITVPVLRFSDASFSGIAGDVTNIPSSNITSFSYNYDSSIVPVYRQQDTIPYRIAFGEKTISSEVTCDNLDQAMSISGLAANFRLTLNNPYNPADFEYYQINGFVTQKTISTSVDKPILQSINIKQNFTDLPPSLGVTYPLSGYPATSTDQGEGIIIYGENLDNIISVEFGGVNGDLIQSENNGTALTARIPYGATSGPIKVTTFGGTSYTSDSFIVNDPGITIDSVNPISGNVGSFVDISGVGFYKISDVTFGGITSSFSTISDSYIQSVVPNYAVYDYIRVISSQRNQTGTYHSKFVPIPEIDSFSPLAGITGTTVYLTGQGYMAVTGVTFNNLQSTSYSITSNTAMTAVVPSGNVLGYIRVNGYSGVTARSNNYFHPSVNINALLPSTVYTGYQLLISGNNFIPEVMYNTIGNNYLVRFSTTTGEFNRVNDRILSGYVPSGTLSGPVQIYDRDGAAYPSYQNLTVRFPAPIIQSFAPLSGRTGDTIFGYGQNFFNLTGVNFTAVVNGGLKYEASSYSSNVAGTMFSVVTPNTPTGFFALRAENAEGTGLASTNYLVNTPYTFPTQLIGFSGLNSGLANTLSFGHYSSLPNTTNDYIAPVGSFDLTLSFPAIPEYNFGAGLGQPRNVLASAGGNQNVSLYIPTTLRYGNITGTWAANALGVTGSFIASIF